MCNAEANLYLRVTVMRWGGCNATCDANGTMDEKKNEPWPRLSGNENVRLFRAHKVGTCHPPLVERNDSRFWSNSVIVLVAHHSFTHFEA